MQVTNQHYFSKLALMLTQHRLALALKISVISAVVVAFYFQDFSLVFRNALSDDSTYHILAIPALFGYMVYRKRAMVRATFSEQSQHGPLVQKYFSLFTGALLCAIAVLVYWFGSNTFTPLEYHMVTLPIFLAGLILILFSTQTLKQIVFPVAFLLFLTPPPIEILYAVGSTLSDLSAHASNALVNLLGMDSTIFTRYGNPLIVLTRADQTVMNFSVDVACSGIYSLIGFTLFAVFIAYITRGKLRHKLTILGLGVPLVLLLNILRLTIIIAIGYHQGDQSSIEVFHAMGASSLMFIGTLTLLGITEKVIKKPPSQPPCPYCNSTFKNNIEDFCPNCGRLHRYPKIKLDKTDMTKMIAIISVIGLLLTIQVPFFAITEGPAEVLTYSPSGKQVSTQILPLPQIEGYNVSYVFRDTDFEKMSGQEVSTAYAYGSTNKTKPTVWVSVEIAQTTGPLHRWETCLINYPLSQGGQPKVNQLEQKDTQTQTNPPKVARYFAFQYPSTNKTQVVLYWYETASFNVNGTLQQKSVKMSLTTYPRSNQELEQAEELLLPIATSINEHWQSVKNWTPIALTLSQNGLGLSTVTILVFSIFLIYKLLFDLQEKKSSLIVYNKIPKEFQHLTQATVKAQKQKSSTTHRIAEELQNLTKTSLCLTGLSKKLRDIENVGLIKKKIINYNDQPIIQWKPQLPRMRFSLQSVLSFISLLAKRIALFFSAIFGVIWNMSMVSLVLIEKINSKVIRQRKR